MRISTGNMRRRVGFVLAVMFMGYVLVTAMFAHTHYFNTRYVTHWHPYHSATHSHSTSDILALELVAPVPFVLSDCTSLNIPEYHFILSVIPFIDNGIVRISDCSVFLRAPPCR